MGTLFASTLRALVREKSLFIWSLAFPILMATIFMFMSANLDGAMEFDPVPTGVVADEAWDTSPFSAVAEALGERGDDQLLDVRRFADGEAAASALVDGEVMGVFSVDEDGEPVLSLAPGLQIGQTTDMDAIDRSILESVVGTYVRDADLMTSVARENPGAFADPGRLEAMFSSVDATEEVSLTHAAPKESVRFYYALFAMAALFGAQIAVVAVCWTQPNLSPLGARRALGAIGRTRTLLATLLACWLLSFCCLLIAFLLGQLGCGESVSNTVGNITGMVLTFLGGTWISLDLMPEAVRVVATFTPVYWLGEGLRAAVGDATGSAAEDVALAVGVLLLFAAAIFVTALVAGRMRATSDDAGGNAAAAVPR